jgi:hypothetical protein
MTPAQIFAVFAYIAAIASVWIVLSDYYRNHG